MAVSKNLVWASIDIVVAVGSSRRKERAGLVKTVVCLGDEVSKGSHSGFYTVRNGAYLSTGDS